MQTRDHETRERVIAESLAASAAAGWPKATFVDGTLTVTESPMLTAWRAVDAALIAAGFDCVATYGEFRARYRSAQIQHISG